MNPLNTAPTHETGVPPVPPEGSPKSSAQDESGSTDERRAQFANKAEARKARYEARAAKMAAYSDAMMRESRRIVENIPFGQPILVGHHSERGHRAQLARSHRAMDRSCKAAKLAEYYQRKAEGVGGGGISSDDPDAIEQLRERMRDLQATQDLSKKINACVRKNDRAALVALGLTDAQIAEVFTPDYMGRVGIPAYSLQNNLANIKRIEQRIHEIEKRQQRADVEQAGAGYVYFEDVDDNRLGLRFPGKPDAPTRDLLKRHAFKWSPTRNAWVRHLNNAGIYAAQQVRKALDAQAVSD
ncbi:MAG: hypothetical protein B7X43_01095 [Thiomonas sp. 15-63-373]|jgi:hypothetical protein|nr:MAG: hypothetical protein B7X43_01095 [Thiomonas sp. 15-63-373]